MAKTILIALAQFACLGHASAATIAVAAGGDLHAALTNARPGDTITLERGATYVGNFTLPNKDGAQFITIRTAGADEVGEGKRVTIESAQSRSCNRRTRSRSSRRRPARTTGV
jgi:hypothetical protein